MTVAGRWSLRNLTERLVELGLEAPVAGVYLHLCQAGPTKAAEVARGMGISRGETYRLLQRAVDLELVSATLDRPARFVAVDVGTLFLRLEEDQRRREERIASARAEVGDALLRLQGQTGDEAPTAFNLLHGRPAIRAAADRLAREATSLIDLLDTHPSAAGMVDASALWRRPAVTIRALLGPGQMLQPPASHAGSVRPAPAGALMQMIVADGRKALIWLRVDPSSRFRSEEEVAVLTTAPSLLTLLGFLFGAAWDAAEG